MAAYIANEAKRRGIDMLSPTDATVTEFVVISRLPLTTEIESIAPLLCEKAEKALRNYIPRPQRDHPIVLRGLLGNVKE